ncbi:hypothetical protein JCM14202_1796 [Agrilactobacillus composti DSM 18527 = JCM 14202]|nr:hypothetical protein JCM14202_1796 [Agrilactobacillus composti DSM 18527 = JCM 14202]
MPQQAEQPTAPEAAAKPATKAPATPDAAPDLVAETQLSLFPEPKAAPVDAKAQQVINALKKLDLMDQTPMDAMNNIYHWQKLLKKKG